MCVWDESSDTEETLILGPLALPLTPGLFTMADAKKRGKKWVRQR